MKKRIQKCLCLLIAVSMAAGGMQFSVQAKETEGVQKEVIESVQPEVSPLSGENGVTVSSREEFMAALAGHKSPITVSSLVTIGQEAEASGRMIPVYIPDGTVIRGTENGILNCRSPIQLEGDVRIENIELTLESSDALGSVPHREIFLAGHTLTLDNVSTWLEGGGFGGSEEELLPTVYAGGFTGSQVGEKASLHVVNPTSKTVFQAIYMGHGSGSDEKVPYQGAALVYLDPGVAVRERVDVSQNSQAEIQISGGENSGVKAKNFYGNEHTTLTISGSKLEGAVIENVGNLVIRDKASVSPKNSIFQNVTLRQGGCLDLNGVDLKNVLISGNFSGVENIQEERGILVVNEQSFLMIEGNVTGTTQFQTESRLFPGSFSLGRPYISVVPENAFADNFVLSQKSLERGYQLNYQQGNWTVSWADEGEILQIGSINIDSAPPWVLLEKISIDQEMLPDNHTYFEITWKDQNGRLISIQEVEDELLFYNMYIVKSEYWESDEPDILAKTDWSNAISLETSDEYPGKYFLQAFEGAKLGDYTLLFTSEYENSLLTVQDVKDQKNKIKAECKISILEKEPEVEKPAPPEEKPTPPEEKPTVPEEKPTPPEEKPIPPVVDKPTVPVEQPKPPVSEEKPKPPVIEEKPKPPVHTHAYRTVVTKATLKKDGSRIQKCSCGKIKSKTVIYYPQKITLSNTSMVYTGKGRKPSVKVRDKKGKTISSKNYKVTYQNNVKVGRATVTITFSGDYSGKIKKTFDITPKAASLSKVTGKSKGFSVKWKKQTAQTTGYEIQYSTSAKFTKKTTSTVTVKSNKTTSKTFSKKKAGKRYYVRIRTYKNVKVGKKTVKLYSQWSKAKSVKVKK